MEIREVSLEEALPVRHNVLLPSKPMEFCLVDEDEDEDHIGVYVDGKVVSVASIYLSNGEKFAKYPSYQGRGIGTALIGYVLSYLKTSNITYFWCDAKISAIGFYQRFGMNTEGKRFYKSDVPYFKMRTSL